MFLRLQTTNRASLVAQLMQERQEMVVPSLGQEDPLEEEMATHSSILAGKIPWTEEAGGPQSVHRVTKSWSRLRAHRPQACTHLLSPSPAFAPLPVASI